MNFNLFPFLSQQRNLNSPERQALRKVIEEDYNNDKEEYERLDNQLYLLGVYDDAGTDSESIILGEVLEDLDTFSDDTIRIILEGGAKYRRNDKTTYGKLRSLSRYHEIIVREDFTYSTLFYSTYQHVIWQHVRDSLNVPDSSLYPDKAAASAVYYATFSMRYERTGRLRREFMRNKSAGTGFIDAQEVNPETAIKQMTPGLAAVIVEHADRIDDITEFIEQRWESVPEKVDTDTLRDYLTTPARSLSQGTL